MPGAVTFGGVGSGIDVEGLISGLVNASKGPLNAAQTRLNDAKAAITTTPISFCRFSDTQTPRTAGS